MEKTRTIMSPFGNGGYYFILTVDAYLNFIVFSFICLLYGLVIRA